MIDIHTHILPELDDGSGSVDESIEMLGMLSYQGVGTVVATPHFYIDEMEPEQFFELRIESAEKLKNSLTDVPRPQIALGAEFQFYSDIYNLDCIEDFCISGTKYILLEMPFDTWTGYTFQALEYLYTERNITPVIAHLERYLIFQKDLKFIQKLKETHSLVQINSEFLLNKYTKRKALSLIKKGVVNFIASDAHNATSRMPVVAEAIERVENKLGADAVASLEFWENKFIENIITF